MDRQAPCVGGNVCNDYMRKWKAAETKAEKFRVICDVNGGEWLFDLDNKGVRLPIDAFTEEYANFINGKQIVDYPHGYTSKMYCRYVGAEDIVADTTNVYMLDCQDSCASAVILIPFATAQQDLQGCSHNGRKKTHVSI